MRAATPIPRCSARGLFDEGWLIAVPNTKTDGQTSFNAQLLLPPHNRGNASARAARRRDQYPCGGAQHRVWLANTMPSSMEQLCNGARKNSPSSEKKQPDGSEAVGPGLRKRKVGRMVAGYRMPVVVIRDCPMVCRPCAPEPCVGFCRNFGRATRS